jgi:hypothetical protein
MITILDGTRRRRARDGRPLAISREDERAAGLVHELEVLRGIADRVANGWRFVLPHKHEISGRGFWYQALCPNEAMTAAEQFVIYGEVIR